MDLADAVDAGRAPVDWLRDQLVGAGHVIDGPFGPRPLVYADYTASGRGLHVVEDIIRDRVLPMYANTHTESSATGRWTTALREQARAVIARSVNAGRDHAVVFTGSGATGAIDHFARVLGLRGGGRRDAGPRTVVLVGPYEHHSNEVLWRESDAEVVEVAEDDQGGIDLADLDRALRRARGSRLIGSFSAASNVTGILTDVAGVTEVLRRHGAAACFDYAASAPYVPIDVASLDAVFISPHKFLGGPGSPGVLVARRSLFTNAVPTIPGGGTVAYVNHESHDFLDDVEHREEGGTPNIIGSIRAGLAFALKDLVGTSTIEEIEDRLTGVALERWSANPAIEVLGSTTRPRLGIVSFLVRHGSGYLHHNFVVALLNDLFGIQARGGCSCAGPYGHRLLGIDRDRSLAFRHEILAGCEGVKPGWVRVNLHYTITDEELRYIVEAVEFVSERGHEFLDLYSFDSATGLWTCEAVDAPQAPTLEDLLDRPQAVDNGTEWLTFEDVAATNRNLIPASSARSDGRQAQVENPSTIS